MITFKEWMKIWEQPHAQSAKPLTFKLGGVPYHDIQWVDPRIERWPNQDIKLRFGYYVVGMPGEGGKRNPPKPIYFVDDDKRSFAIYRQDLQEIPKIPKTEKAAIMPGYWYHYAMFMNGEQEVIDNIQPEQGAAFIA